MKNKGKVWNEDRSICVAPGRSYEKRSYRKAEEGNEVDLRRLEEEATHGFIDVKAKTLETIYIYIELVSRSTNEKKDSRRMLISILRCKIIVDRNYFTEFVVKWSKRLERKSNKNWYIRSKFFLSPLCIKFTVQIEDILTTINRYYMNEERAETRFITVNAFGIMLLTHFPYERIRKLLYWMYKWNEVV